MKKIILLFSFIVFSFAAFSQGYIHAFASQFGVWQDEEWKMSDAVECSIDFKLDGSTIYAGDVNNSVYITYEMMSDDGVTVQWKAVDEMLRECYVVMSTDGSVQMLIIIYHDRLYKYIYTFD